MPLPTTSMGTSCEFRPPSDSSKQCSTSGRLAIPTAPLCKQPAAQSPVLSGLTRLPARLAKLLSKAHTARATQCGDLPHLEASDAHATSGEHASFLAIPAHPSKATTATANAATSASSSSSSAATITATSGSTSTSSFTAAPCSSSSSTSTSSTSAHPEHATAQPATDQTVLTGSWPMPHTATASPSPCQPTVPQPPPLSTRPSAASPPPQRISTAGISASTSRKGYDHVDPDRPHLAGLQHQQSTPQSPRICMYITELGCADLAASWIHHSETSSLSAASLAAANAWAPPPAHTVAAPDALQPDAPNRGLERQATVHLPAARRASCPDCPQAFDPTMGDLALLDCPLVQSLMLSTM